MWHDYFKPEHVEKYPDLHDVCWKASKQASQVKRTVDLEEAQKLLDLIDQIDEMWKGTGGPATTRLPGLTRPRTAARVAAALFLVATAIVAQRLGTSAATLLGRPRGHRRPEHGAPPRVGRLGPGRPRRLSGQPPAPG